jgi:hypothetical protein
MKVPRAGVAHSRFHAPIRVQCLSLGGINMFSDLLFATTGNNSRTTKELGRDKRLRLSFAILWCEGKANA